MPTNPAPQEHHSVGFRRHRYTDQLAMLHRHCSRRLSYFCECSARDQVMRKVVIKVVVKVVIVVVMVG